MIRFAFIGLLAMFAVTSVPVNAQETQALEAAYQREFAYLAAEKTALEARLDALRVEEVRQEAQADGDLATLEARYTALQIEVEATEGLLDGVERASEQAAEADDMLDTTLFMASSTLGDIFLPEGDDMPTRGDALATIFTAGADKMASGGSIHSQPGEFFLPDGSKVDGTVVHVGTVARYGVAASGATGALVPVGEGRFRLHDQGAATASALAAGSPPANAGIFLFESAEKGIEERVEKSLWSVVEDGGVVGLVIIGLGVLALLLVMARSLGLFRAGSGLRTTPAVLELAEAGQIEAAIRKVDGKTGTVPRVLRVMLPKLGNPTALQDFTEEALLRETARVDRFGTAIMVIAAVAPLLGLLGTVTGMIATFEVITEYGTGDPRMLSGGISAALVTTQFGLIVAIPSLLVGNLLAAWGERVIGSAEEAALALRNRTQREDEPDDAPEALYEQQLQVANG